MSKEAKKRIAVIAGIRSQYVKMASFQRGVMKYAAGLNCNFDFVYIDTGQHYDRELAGGFIEDLGIKFDYQIIYEDKDPIDIFADMYRKLFRLIRDMHIEKPFSYLVVFGDANTSMVGALVATKQNIPLMHIEAGLRLGSLKSPEESNRIVADRLASLRSVSCKSHFENLIKEGLSDNSFFAGDIIYDLVNDISASCDESKILYENDRKRLSFYEDDFIIASIHRDENIRDKILPVFFDALKATNRSVIFLAHKRILNSVSEINYDKRKITIAEYVSYPEFIKALKACAYVVTDSGALQREAYYLKKRCLIRQEVAFWQILVEKGVHKLIGKDIEDMLSGIAWIENKIKGNDYPELDDFGNGTAMKTILELIANGYNT
jgi:UDP-GlcNAc3NAcA epimerase